MIHTKTIATITLLTILCSLAMSYGIDQSIRNQDTMLCNSAKVSGNEEYTRKCQCYYAGNDISCIQKEVTHQ